MHHAKVTTMKRTVLVVLAVIGFSVPAFAQVDLSGHWAVRQHEDWQERGPGPEIVDYTGLPINDDARARALAYSPSALSLPERQCLYYAPHYNAIGPFGLEIWADTDPNTGRVIAWNIGAFIDKAINTIWMDDRPHPGPNALRTFAGFTTGHWEGKTLVAYMTHFKEGYLRRNGVPTSDQASMTMYITRHGDMLTMLEVVEDPVYFTEPFLVSRNWQLDPGANMTRVPAPCVPEAEIADLKGGSGETVPHVLPGKNPFVGEMTRLYNLPENVALGGAETMYPEFKKRLDSYQPPKSCGRYCCGWGGAPGRTAPNLQCITGGSPAIMNER
jgi:hypothetical protein